MKWYSLDILAAFRRSSWLVVLLGLALASSGCKTRKQRAESYRYLIKEDSQPSESPTTIRPGETKVYVGNNKVILALMEADAYLGTPYRHGGDNKSGIDCSGLTLQSYLAAGVKLPRSSRDQALFGMEIKRQDLKPGDLLFFSNDNNTTIDHVGMVHHVEGNSVTFIHASSSKGVRYDKLEDAHWKDKLIVARRVAP
jgi:probable lipoprotein NlpC